MSNFRFRKTALAVAVLSLGVSVGALAQGSAGSSVSGTRSSGTGAAAAQGGSSGASAPDRSAAAKGDAKQDRIARSDRKFMEEAHLANMAEVRLGRLAQDKAASDEVKQFGRRMVEDHGKAIEDLGRIASAEGVKLPSQLDAKHQKTYDRLQKLSGAEFDLEYMKQMAAEHKKTVSKFDEAAESAKDPQLQAYAREALPTLREHREMAETSYAALSKRPTASSDSQPPSQARAGSHGR